MQAPRIVLAAVLLSGVALAPVAQARCYNKVVYHTRPVQDPHRVAGTAIGAVLGAAIGHQVGGGRGKDLATVGGAVAGGVAGHKIQRYRQQNPRRETVRICD